MLKRFSGLTLTFLLVLCFSTAFAQKSKKNKVKLDRVLIVGMTNNYDARVLYEQELSYRLREKGYSLFSSVNVDTANKKLFTKEELLSLVEEKNVHGVITIRLIDVTSVEKYTSSARNLSYQAAAPTNYFFNYIDMYYGVYNYSYQPQERVELEIKLFDASDKSVIFEKLEVSENAETQEDRVGEFAKKFAKALDKSGHLKKKDK